MKIFERLKIVLKFLHLSQIGAADRAKSPQHLAASHSTHLLDVLYKIFPAVLQSYHPHAASFLRSFQLSSSDQLAMLTRAAYHEPMRAAVCNWVRDNEQKWTSWIPADAVEPLCPTSGTEGMPCGGSAAGCANSCDDCENAQ